MSVSFLPKRSLVAPLLIGSILCGILSSVNVCAEDVRVEDEPPEPHVVRFDPYLSTLKDYGIGNDADSLAQFLHSLMPTETTEREVNQLVNQLGHDEYPKRAEAERKILAMVTPPTAALQSATTHSDIEIRWRAKRLLLKLQRGDQEIAPRAVLGYIKLHGTPGLANALLEFAPHFEDSIAVGEAFRASSRTADLPLIQKLINGPAHSLRQYSVEALIDIQGNAALPQLRELIQSKESDLRLPAAIALAKAGDEASLKPLLASLESADMDERARAVSILRAATGQYFNLLASDTDKNRKEAVEKWQEWYASLPSGYEIAHPLVLKPPYLGRLLVAIHPSTLREFDASGKVLFEQTGFKYIAGCRGLPNGHRLACEFSGKYVVEYDARGKEVWRAASLPSKPNSVSRLENGNTLVTMVGPDQVAELNPAGKVVWSVALSGYPADHHRLPNGNTLVSCATGGKIVEVNRAGKTVWTFDTCNYPITFDYLENGNLLVCEMRQNKAVEYDRTGHIVWEKAGFSNPYKVQRLENGNTLLSDSKGVHEIRPDGTIENTHKMGRGRFCSY